ncbi:hypothetical protein WJX82_011122 [Trebouxia sp. C0006]
MTQAQTAWRNLQGAQFVSSDDESWLEQSGFHLSGDSEEDEVHSRTAQAYVRAVHALKGPSLHRQRLPHLNQVSPLLLELPCPSLPSQAGVLHEQAFADKALSVSQTLPVPAAPLAQHIPVQQTTHVLSTPETPQVQSQAPDTSLATDSGATAAQQHTKHALEMLFPQELSTQLSLSAEQIGLLQAAADNAQRYLDKDAADGNTAGHISSPSEGTGPATATQQTAQWDMQTAIVDAFKSILPLEARAQPAMSSGNSAAAISAAAHKPHPSPSNGTRQIPFSFPPTKESQPVSASLAPPKTAQETLDDDPYPKRLHSDDGIPISKELALMRRVHGDSPIPRVGATAVSPKLRDVKSLVLHKQYRFNLLDICNAIGYFAIGKQHKVEIFLADLHNSHVHQQQVHSIAALFGVRTFQSDHPERFHERYHLTELSKGPEAGILTPHGDMLVYFILELNELTKVSNMRGGEKYRREHKATLELANAVGRKTKGTGPNALSKGCVMRLQQLSHKGYLAVKRPKGDMPKPPLYPGWRGRPRELISFLKDTAEGGVRGKTTLHKADAHRDELAEGLKASTPGSKGLLKRNSSTATASDMGDAKRQRTAVTTAKGAVEFEGYVVPGVHVNKYEPSSGKYEPISGKGEGSGHPAKAAAGSAIRACGFSTYWYDGGLPWHDARASSRHGKWVPISHDSPWSSLESEPGMAK